MWCGAQSRWKLRSLVVAVVVGACLTAKGQIAAPDPGDLRTIADSQNTVEQVVRSLESHVLTPVQALDPTLDERSRQAQLRHFRTTGYMLQIESMKPVATGSDGFASMQASFRFRDGMTRKMRSNATLQFVQRGDRWYFANYNFLDVGRYLTRVIAGAALIAAVLGWGLWLALRRSRVRSAPVAGAGAGLRSATGVSGFEPQGYASGAQAPLVQASVAPPEELRTPSSMASPEEAGAVEPSGWQPKMEPTHQQTVAYPQAPPPYEAPSGTQPRVEMPVQTEPAHPQTTAYPEPPPRYEERPKR